MPSAWFLPRRTQRREHEGHSGREVEPQSHSGTEGFTAKVQRNAFGMGGLTTAGAKDTFGIVFTTVTTTRGTRRTQRDACGMGVVNLSAVIDPDSG